MPKKPFYLPQKKKTLFFVLKVVCPQYTLLACPIWATGTSWTFKMLARFLHRSTCPGQSGKCLCSNLACSFVGAIGLSVSLLQYSIVSEAK